MHCQLKSSFLLRAQPTLLDAESNGFGCPLYLPLEPVVYVWYMLLDDIEVGNR